MKKSIIFVWRSIFLLSLKSSEYWRILNNANDVKASLLIWIELQCHVNFFSLQFMYLNICLPNNIFYNCIIEHNMNVIPQFMFSDYLFSCCWIVYKRDSVCVKRGIVGKHALRICRIAYTMVLLYTEIASVASFIPAQSEKHEIGDAENLESCQMNDVRNSLKTLNWRINSNYFDQWWSIYAKLDKVYTDHTSKKFSLQSLGWLTWSKPSP